MSKEGRSGGKEESPCSPDEERVLDKKGFKIGEKINFGSFSKVYKAKYLDKDIAVKVIDLTKTSKEYRQKFLPRELNTLQKLRHPNIVTIHKIMTINQKIYIFMDLAEGGDILDHLKHQGPIPEEQAKIWFKQAAEALRYIHSHGIAHRDLKSENILLDKCKNAKLTDFGFSRDCFDHRTGRGVLSETYCGSAAYVAPEVLRSVPYNPMLSDVWSLGVVLYVMVNNALPFDDSDLGKMVTRQVAKQWHFSSKVADKLSNDLKDLIKQMLEPDLSKRPTMAKVIRHPWLRDSSGVTGISVVPKSKVQTKSSQSLPEKKPEREPEKLNPKVGSKLDRQSDKPA